MPPAYLTPARRDLNLPAALRMGIRTPRGPSALEPLKRKGYLPWMCGGFQVAPGQDSKESCVTPALQVLPTPPMGPRLRSAPPY